MNYEEKQLVIRNIRMQDRVEEAENQVRTLLARVDNLRRENDGLRAELESTRRGGQEFAFKLGEKYWHGVDEADDLRAYATEAYEHGVSDGIDIGKRCGYIKAVRDGWGVK